MKFAYDIMLGGIINTEKDWIIIMEEQNDLNDLSIRYRMKSNSVKCK